MGLLDTFIIGVAVVVGIVLLVTLEGVPLNANAPAFSVVGDFSGVVVKAPAEDWCVEPLLRLSAGRVSIGKRSLGEMSMFGASSPPWRSRKCSRVSQPPPTLTITCRSRRSCDFLSRRRKRERKLV